MHNKTELDNIDTVAVNNIDRVRTTSRVNNTARVHNKATSHNTDTVHNTDRVNNTDRVHNKVTSYNTDTVHNTDRVNHQHSFCSKFDFVLCIFSLRPLFFYFWAVHSTSPTPQYMGISGV